MKKKGKKEKKKKFELIILCFRHVGYATLFQRFSNHLGHMLPAEDEFRSVFVILPIGCTSSEI